MSVGPDADGRVLSLNRVDAVAIDDACSIAATAWEALRRRPLNIDTAPDVHRVPAHGADGPRPLFNEARWFMRAGSVAQAAQAVV